MTGPQKFRKRLAANIKKARHEIGECPECGEHDSGFIFVHPGQRYKCLECENVFEVAQVPLPFIDDRKMLEAADEFDSLARKKDWPTNADKHKAEDAWLTRWEPILGGEHKHGKGT